MRYAWVWIAAIMILSNSAFAMEKEIPVKGQAPIPLVEDGAARINIVVAERPDPVGVTYWCWRLDRSRSTRYAAEVLQKYVEKSTGVRLPILTERQAPKHRPMILVGRSGLTADLEAERAALPPEGFIIRTQPRRVFIVGEIAPQTECAEYAGADRGTLWGVFEFLERVCGIRWYFPDELGVVIPETKTLQAPPMNLTKAPFYAMRTAGLTGGDPELFLAMTRYGNTTQFMVNHSCNDWYIYAKEHPEVFAVNGEGKSGAFPGGYGGNAKNHLCYTNPKTLEIDLARVDEFYEKGVDHFGQSVTPREKYVCFAPKDLENIYHCQCPRCRAQWWTEAKGAPAYREDSKLSEIVFGYAARFADALNKKYPGKRLATFAYAGFMYPPTSVKLPENVDVLICTVKANALLASAERFRTYTDLVDQWSAQLGGDRKRLFLWEYFCYPSAYAPTLYPHVMQKWFRANREKISGAFNNGYNMKRNPMVARFTLPNVWMWHKLLWNPDEDVDGLLNEMYDKLFGPAAPGMKVFFDTCIRQWEEAPWPDRPGPGCTAYVSDAALYGSVYPPAAVERLRAALNEAAGQAPAQSVEGRRVAFFAEPMSQFFANAEAYWKGRTRVARYAAPSKATPPALDGQLNDPCWADVPAIELRTWGVGAEPPASTTVRMLVCKDVLYLGASLEGVEVEKLVAAGAERDDPAIRKDDFFAVDFGLRERGALVMPSFYRIAVNPKGVLLDGVQMVPQALENVHKTAFVETWNPAVETAVASGGGFWSVELAIPLSSFPELQRTPRKTIPLQLVRQNRSAPGGLMSWSPMFVESYEYDLDRMGELTLP